MPLLCWLSPAFPVGSYAYSHGLEWAAETGDVRDAETLASWLDDIVLRGAGRNDAILLAAAYRAAAAGDAGALAEANDLALALAPSAELRLETAQQGRSFLEAILGAWPDPPAASIARPGESRDLDRAAGLDPGFHRGERDESRLASLAAGLDEVAYPVALALAAACHGVPLADAVRGHLTAFSGALVSAALRLAPIGQTAGQRVLARLLPGLAALAEEALRSGLDDLGGPTFRADLGSLRHETQYTRLFRS